jgi:hypothetical protein
VAKAGTVNRAGAVNRAGRGVAGAGARRPRSALDLLSGPGEDAVTSLTRLILAADADGRLDGALKNLRRAARQAAARAAAVQAAGLLDVELIGLVVAGWREHRDLAITARRTLAAQGRTELADLAAHRITTSQQPAVTIVAGGQQVITLELDLLIEFDITGLVAAISAGRLAAFHCGRCDVRVTLALQGTDMLTRHAHFELPGVIPVSPGLRLLPARAYAVAEQCDDPAWWMTAKRAG